MITKAHSVGRIANAPVLPHLTPFGGRGGCGVTAITVAWRPAREMYCAYVSYASVCSPAREAATSLACLTDLSRGLGQRY